ncbi:hypothetical protein BpHYR1_031472, partial [Brachionus plicatilis]
DLIEKSSLKEIEKIKDVRNIIAHSSDMSLCDQEYEKHLTEIENSLINLGLNKKDIEHFKLNFNSTETKEVNNEKILDYKKGDVSFLNQNSFSKSIESKGIDFTLDLSQKKIFFFNEKPNYQQLAEYFQQLAGKWITNTKSNGTGQRKLSNATKSAEKSKTITKSLGLKTNGTGLSKISNATKSAEKSKTITKSLGLKTNGTGLSKISNATKSAEKSKTIIESSGLKTNGTGQAKLSNATKSVQKSTTISKSSVLKTNETGQAKLSNATKSAGKSTANTKSSVLKTNGTGLAKLSSATISVGKSTANNKTSDLKTNGTGQTKLSNATKSAGKSTANTKSSVLKTNGTGLAKLSYAIKSADRSTTNTNSCLVVGLCNKKDCTSVQYSQLCVYIDEVLRKETNFKLPNFNEIGNIRICAPCCRPAGHSTCFSAPALTAPLLNLKNVFGLSNKSAEKALNMASIPAGSQDTIWEASTSLTGKMSSCFVLHDVLSEIQARLLHVIGPNQYSINWLDMLELSDLKSKFVFHSDTIVSSSNFKESLNSIGNVHIFYPLLNYLSSNQDYIELVLQEWISNSKKLKSFQNGYTDDNLNQNSKIRRSLF